METKRKPMVPSCDGKMVPRTGDNFQVLHFHQVHGDNLILEKNGKVACRLDGFCNGIAYSDRPVKLCEPIYIKLLEISSNWSGALKIGFTMNDPLSMKSKLPRSACPDLLQIPGNWVKGIPEVMIKKDSIICYYVDPNGTVHFCIDSEYRGILIGDINTAGKLWAIIDVYGNTVAVEFIDDPQVFMNDLSHISRNMCDQNYASALMSQLDVLPFHDVHGSNILLKSNRTVAFRTPGFNSIAYIFTKRPLILGEKVAIQILRSDVIIKGGLVYGFTSYDPSRINPNNLPADANELHDLPEYWIVKKDPNLYVVGDILLFSISNIGEVTVTKNFDYISNIFHVKFKRPLWLFLNIIGSISKVHILGSSATDISDIINQLGNIKVSLPDDTEDSCEDLEAEISNQISAPPVEKLQECVLCCEEQVDCAVYRCGHMCMCYSCATRLWKQSSNSHCPICRKTIDDVIKIYK